MSEPASKELETDKLVYDAELEAPPEKVSTPEIREAWLGVPEAGPAGVTRADPPSRLDLVWPTREGDTWVSFEIEAGEGGGSHLTIVHRAAAPVVIALHKARRETAMSATGWRIAA
jgi:uncharacterized protein YndB with AHSA1/START domain